MSALMPVFVVLLALAAAGFIAWIAWDLTAKETQDVLERALGREGMSSGTDGRARPRGEAAPAEDGTALSGREPDDPAPPR